MGSWLVENSWPHEEVTLALSVYSDGLQVAGYLSVLQGCTHKHSEVYRHTKTIREAQWIGSN